MRDADRIPFVGLLRELSSEVARKEGKKDIVVWITLQGTFKD